MMSRGSLEGTLTTPTTPGTGDNPFGPPEYAFAPPPMPDAPGAAGTAIPHWFSVKVRITLIVCVLCALGIGALGALGIAAIGRNTAPSTGDCLYLTKESAGSEAYHRVSCSAQNAVYKVDDTSYSEFGCGYGDYVQFEVSSGTSRTLCLALNVQSGDCLRSVGDNTAVNKVSCADPTAEDRVEVLSGLNSREDCVNAEKTFQYSTPRRLVCLVPAGENI
jgi:hypothetical protein